MTYNTDSQPCSWNITYLAHFTVRARESVESERTVHFREYERKRQSFEILKKKLNVLNKYLRIDIV